MTDRTSVLPRRSAIPSRGVPRPTHGPSLRTLTVVLGLALAAMPVLRPGGPANSAPVDLLIVVSIITTFLWAAHGRRRLRLPYAWAVTCMVVAGVTGTVWAATPGAGSTSVGAIAQDLLMFAWAAALATAASEGTVRRSLARTWAASATVWAGLLILGVAAGIPILSGATERDGTRAALTFGDPNLAASYFVISAFIVAATQYPGRRWVRWTSLTMIAIAIGLTGSNGGLVSLGVGVVVGGVVVLHRRQGPITAIGVAAVTVLLVGVAAGLVSLTEIRNSARQAGPVADASVGHSDESEGTRSVLLHEVSGLARTGPLTGRGAASTEASLRQAAAPYVKEAHSDYTAVLAERGPLGAIGLILLVGSVAVRLTRRRGRRARGP